MVRVHRSMETITIEWSLLLILYKAFIGSAQKDSSFTYKNNIIVIVFFVFLQKILLNI